MHPKARQAEKTLKEQLLGNTSSEMRVMGSEMEAKEYRFNKKGLHVFTGIGMMSMKTHL